MIDEVSVALESLGGAAAAMRQVYLGPSVTRPDLLTPLLRDAEDTFQVARATIARLGMRPHADAALVAMAAEAAKAHNKAVVTVRDHLARNAAARASKGEDALHLSVREPLLGGARLLLV